VPFVCNGACKYLIFVPYTRQCQVCSTCLQELAMLQGLNPNRLAGWWLCMSEASFNGAVGNAMSANVLSRVMVNVLRASGLATVQDPWLDPMFANFSC